MEKNKYDYENVVENIRQQLKNNSSAVDIFGDSFNRPLSGFIAGFPEATIAWLERALNDILQYWNNLNNLNLDLSEFDTEDEIEAKLCHIDEEISRPYELSYSLIKKIKNHSPIDELKTLDLLRSFLELVAIIDESKIPLKVEFVLDKEVKNSLNFVTNLFGIINLELRRFFFLTDKCIYLLFEKKNGPRLEYREVFISDEIKLLDELNMNVNHFLETSYPVKTSLILTNNYSILKSKKYNSYTLETLISDFYNEKKFTEYLNLQKRAKFSSSTILELKGELLQYSPKKQDYRITEIQSIDNYIDDFLIDKIGNLFVISNAGGGKTFVANKVYDKINSEMFRSRYAIYFDMGLMNRDESIEDFITRYLADFFSINSNEIFEFIYFLAQQGKIIIILDGLDEIFQSIQLEELIHVFSEISKLFTENSKFVITCRSSFLQSSKHINELLNRNAMYSDILNHGLTSAGIDPLSLPNFSILKLLDIKLFKNKDFVNKFIETEDITNINLSPLEYCLFENQDLNIGNISIFKKNQGYILTPLLYNHLLIAVNGNENLLSKLAHFFCGSFLKGDSHFGFDDVINEFNLESYDLKFSYSESKLKEVFCKTDKGDLRFIHKSYFEFLFAFAFCIDSSIIPEGFVLSEEVRKHINSISINTSYYKINSDNNYLKGILTKGSYIIGKNDKLKIHINRRDVEFDKFSVTVCEYNYFLDKIREIDVSSFQHPNQPEFINHSPDYNRLKIKDFYSNPKYSNYPATCISWWSAYTYANFMNKRLPSREEWECACRGRYGNIFPWGNTINLEIANCADFWAKENILTYDVWKSLFDNNINLRVGESCDVSLFEFNTSPIGLRNMSGNVWEYTSSLSEDYKNVIICGGSYDNPFNAIKASSQGLVRLGSFSNAIGFRCCKDV